MNCPSCGTNRVTSKSRPKPVLRCLECQFEWGPKAVSTVPLASPAPVPTSRVDDDTYMDIDVRKGDRQAACSHPRRVTRRAVEQRATEVVCDYCGFRLALLSEDTLQMMDPRARQEMFDNLLSPRETRYEYNPRRARRANVDYIREQMRTMYPLQTVTMDAAGAVTVEIVDDMIEGYAAGDVQRTDSGWPWSRPNVQEVLRPVLAQSMEVYYNYVKKTLEADKKPKKVMPPQVPGRRKIWDDE